MKLKNEIPLLIIVLIPFMYLFYLWEELPTKVPMHWDIKGEVDRYGDKWELILIPALLPLLSYLIFLIVPFVDPKKKIKATDGKYQTLKTFLVTLMSALSLYLIYIVKHHETTTQSGMYLFIGLLIAGLGNYFKTLKHNYFIGIRTPWTLESEEVWKKTHQTAGILWFIGGLIIMLSNFVFSPEVSRSLVIYTLAVVTLVPLVQSYLLHRRLKPNQN